METDSLCCGTTAYGPAVFRDWPDAVAGRCRAVEEGGLTFQSDDPNVPPALDRFVRASGETLPLADQLPAWKWANAC